VSFADGVTDARIGRCAHRHSLIEQTFMASHQFGYPCRIVDTGYGPSVPPVFLDIRPPSLLRVPASLVPRSLRYYEGATTSHLRIGGRLFVSLPPPT
jgi:hypothetical protein